MKKLFLTSPIPPSVNNYLLYKIGSIFVKGRARKIVQVSPTPETAFYKNYFTNYVKEQIRLQKWEIPSKEKLVIVECIFYFERKHKDPNNHLKVPFDVFSDARVYFDDDIALPVVKRVYIDSTNPRIEFTIYETDMIGIFENVEEFQKFKKENCEMCRRNLDKCSVLKASLDNRITENVVSLNCSKKK